MADRVNSLLADLKRLREETGSLDYLGCGREHNCGVQGCAVLREAVDVLQEYVDRCKRYADEVIALQGRCRWIPVTERLPAEGMRVLAASGNFVSGEGYVGHDGIWRRYYDAPWNALLVGACVTHWMPLPLPSAQEVNCDG